MTDLTLDLEVYGSEIWEFGIARVVLPPAMQQRIKALAEAVLTLNVYKVVEFDDCVDPLNEGTEQDDPPEPADVRLDCVCLNVTRDGFFWSGYLKHSDNIWETENTHISVLN